MTIKVTKPEINIREELADLKQDTGLKGQELMRADTAQEARTAIGAGRKNLIINGDFSVSQRGDYTSATALTSTGTYHLDRWTAKTMGGSSGTIQHKTDQTLPNGVVTNSLRLTLTSAASTYYALVQWIEGYKQFRGQTTTLSFWYKSNTDQALNYYNYVTQTHIDVPNTNGVWKKFSHTYTWGATGTTNTRIEFYPHQLTLPDDAYIEIAQVQLEFGSVATEFEHRSYGEELALCQRYYERFVADASAETLVCIGMSYTTTRSLAHFFYLVEKRDLPAFSKSSSSDFQALTGGSGGWQTATNVTAVAGLRSSRLDISGLSGLTTNGACEIRLNTAPNGAHWFAFDAEL